MKPVKEPLDPIVRADSGEVEHSDADLWGAEVVEDDDVKAVRSRRRDFLGWRMLGAMIVVVVVEGL